VLWHLSAVLLDTGFSPPSAQLPLYRVNALLLDFSCGLLRARFGSVEIINDADFLSDDPKAEILCNNAVRFLRLDEQEMQRRAPGDRSRIP
jgi:hypothetical protein